MESTAEGILAILDDCCDAFSFPMLDNGYVYLAATRLSLFRSYGDWAMTIEVFGFSPRAGCPDTHVYTFSNRLSGRKEVSEFVSSEAHSQYLAGSPNNESRFVHPVEEGAWQDSNDLELVAEDARSVVIRGKSVDLPAPDEYAKHGIQLEDYPSVFVYEACRYLAATQRDLVLATESERRGNVPAALEQILQLEEWSHPDVVNEAMRPSQSETFQQLATVLVTGDKESYQPSQPANTHWKNWPNGGLL